MSQFQELADNLLELYYKATLGVWSNGWLCDDDRKPVTPDGMKKEVCECIDNRRTDKFYLISLGDKMPAICHTGCGPTSEANGQFIAAAHELIPRIIQEAADTISQLEARVAGLEAALSLYAEKQL